MSLFRQSPNFRHNTTTRATRDALFLKWLSRQERRQNSPPLLTAKTVTEQTKAMFGVSPYTWQMNIALTMLKNKLILSATCIAGTGSGKTLPF